MGKEGEQIGFLEAILGLVTAPGQTTETLFEAERPRHVFSLFGALMISFFGPIIWHVNKYGFVLYRAEVVFALFFVFAFTILFFVLAQIIFLRMLGVRARIDQSVAVMVYSSVPVIAYIWFMYGANYYYHGSFSLVDLLLREYVPLNPTFMRMIPLVTIVMYFAAALIYCHSIRALDEMHFFTAMLIAVLSVVPLYLALLLGLSIAELAVPGAFQILQRAMTNPASVLYFSK